MNNIIETKKLSKSYFLNKKLNVLNNVNIKIKKGDNKNIKNMYIILLIVKFFTIIL